MTGRWPTSTGMFLNDLHLPERETCMAEIFRQARYATAYIGKWHLDGHGRSAYIPPERRRGWDYWKAAECDHNYNHSHYYAGTSKEKKFWAGYNAFAQTKDAGLHLPAGAAAAAIRVAGLLRAAAFSAQHGPAKIPRHVSAREDPVAAQCPRSGAGRGPAGRPKAITPIARRWTTAWGTSSARCARPG